MSTKDKVEDIVNTFDKNKIRCIQCGEWFNIGELMTDESSNYTRWCKHCLETIELVPPSELKLEKVNTNIREQNPGMKVVME